MEFIEQRQAILKSITGSVTHYLDATGKTTASYASATGMLEAVSSDAIMEMPESQRESFLNGFRVNVEKYAEQLGKR